jgi:hypothetical protein
MRFDQRLADKLDAAMLELLLPEDAVESLGKWLADPEGASATRTEVVLTPSPTPRSAPEPRHVVRWIMTNPEHLAETDAAELKEIRTVCPELDAAARHVREFAALMRDRRSDLLSIWMNRVLADDLPALHSLVSGLRRDIDAVIAAFFTDAYFTARDLADASRSSAEPEPPHPA